MARKCQNSSAAYNHGGMLQAVVEGKVRTVIDCLMNWEIHGHGWTRPAETDKLKVYPLPFGWTEDEGQWERDWGRDSSGIVRLLLRKHNKPIRETFKILANSNRYPVIYYCRGALHRSKIIASLIYLAVGVSEQEVSSWLRLELYLHRTMLDEINRHGGINSYLKHIGVSAEEIEKLKAILLE